MFANELLACREAIEIFFKSKFITSPSVTSIFNLLLNQLNTLIVLLENPSQDVVGRSMNIEQSIAMKVAHNVMKAKLLKYDSQVKRKSIFLIATIFDPSLKLEYIPIDEQEYIMQY